MIKGRVQKKKKSGNFHTYTTHPPKIKQFP